MAARPPSALSLSTPLLERFARRDSPSASPTRDRRRNMTTYESQPWAVSPSATLQAFTDGIDPAISPEAQQLLSGITNATAAEKALGARVAIATKKVKDWCAELERWTWDDTFESPLPPDTHSQEKDTQHGATAHATDNHGGDSSVYWGPLPASEVLAYGARLDEIKDELEDLNMDELKGHILDMYPMERPRPGSGYGNKRAELHLLDDFSYVVTHTMLQALPCLSYLNQLTRVWSVRLMVLHEVPHFLAGLDDVTKDMRLGWDTLDLPDDPQNSTKALDGWKDIITTTRGSLQSKITSLGRKLDRMLDALEGMNDVLPDSWIDDFEAIEANYSKWAADAQKRVFELDMLLSRPPEKLTRPTSARGADRPFGFGAHPHRMSRNGLLSADNSEHRLLSEEHGAGEKLPSLVPKLNRTSTTFGPNIPSKIITRGHQRSRSRSEPDVCFSPFKFAQTLETIEGTPTKSRVFDLGAEQDDSDDSEAIAESSVQESGERRASVTSVESYARSHVKSMDTRRGSNSSNAQDVKSDCSSPRRYSHPGGLLPRTDEEAISSESSDGYAHPFDTPIVKIEEEYSSPTDSQKSSPEASVDNSPSLRPLPGRPTAKTPRPPLNSAMHKRRSKSQQVPIVIPSDSDSDNDSKKNTPGSRPKYLGVAKNKGHRRVSSATADLEQQIRRLITSVHAPIRLTSGSVENSPVESNSKRAFSESRPPSSLKVSRKTSAPSITMSPVKYDHSRPGHLQRQVRQNDSDIKLYHLMQPGKDKPIKLFVRRVGENGERLMVRVGGGWADLGEYLRQYAEHHSRRVVSEGKVEALGMQGSPDLARPTSSHSNTSGSKSAGRFLDTPPTSAPSGPRSRSNSAMSNYSSADRDETVDSGASQRSWAGSEVGLAGPKTKKLDLSGEKLEWIEGMMNQAKMLGAQQAANNSRKLFMKQHGQQQ